MHDNDPLLHPLPPEAEGTPPPRQMTFPLCYEPHPLVRLAARELTAELSRHPDWQLEAGEGKMMGVLVVEGGGFLAAFSGTLCGRSTLPYFVPPVFDLHGTYFEQEEARIAALPPTEERTHRSQALQQWLFRQFSFHNARGEERPLLDIFAPRVPPAGAGECCAPKLLEYAYRHSLRPLCMGEFWVGRAPRGEVRREGHFYPACQHKCKPILEWMMQGLDVEQNPLSRNYENLLCQLRIVYEEKEFVVVDKPSGLLSVPGKEPLPSLQDIMRQRYPEAQGPMIVHRLDMETSGLMVVALNEDAYHALQQQFITHTVRKRYTALLERPMEPGSKGTIDLLICPNPYDRPRQIVNQEHGRRSITHYEVTGNTPDGHARIHLWPDTGRTHQLRLHMAAPEGLGNPIVGDRLYGTAAQRLMLVADRLEFLHPVSHKTLRFEIES